MTLFMLLVFLMHHIQLVFSGDSSSDTTSTNSSAERNEVIETLLNRCFNEETWENHGPPRKDALIMKASDMHPTLGWYYMDISLQVRVVKVSETRSNCFVEMNLDPEDRKGDLTSRFGALGEGNSLQPTFPLARTFVQIIIFHELANPNWQLNWCPNGLIGRDVMYTFIHSGVEAHSNWSGMQVRTHTPEPNANRPAALTYRIHKNTPLNLAIEAAEFIEDKILSKCVISSEVSQTNKDENISSTVLFAGFAAAASFIALLSQLLHTKVDPDESIYVEL